MGRVRSTLRVLVLTVRSALLLPIGLMIYWGTGRTPEYGHQALIWMFCVTRGRSNDFLSRVISRFRPRIPIDGVKGVLGDLSGDRLNELAGRLREDGFVVFERALSADACDRLMRFARSTPSCVRRMDGELQTAASEAAVPDPEHPRAVRYDYAASALLDNPDVQALLADPSILALAQEYLECRPVADVLNMWWHTNYHKQPDSHAAQFFHFDMDRVKWLKVFVYLTDVKPENGPHSFVKGSHRTRGIPPRLLLRGYERLTDEEVQQCYAKEACLEFSAPRGSIIVEDTRGLHKGANVRGAPRLILQLQMSNALFGAKYPRARISRVQDASLKKMLAAAPEIYTQYL
jgi:ectoine hydroxylase-related dioxygenase (phytanoyl-CoA dioxygenase family)